MTLTIKLKINIKRYDDVITTLNDRLKILKNVRRKIFKYEKKKKFSLQMKNLNVRKNSKKRKNSFFDIFCYICQEKNIMFRIVFNFQKTRK